MPDTPKANTTTEAPKAIITPGAPKDIIVHDPNHLKLTVADVTDWLETFAGPEGQQRLAEQGSVGFDNIKDEARELLDILRILVPDNLSAGARRRGAGARAHGDLLDKIDECQKLLQADKAKVQTALRDLLSHPDLPALQGHEATGVAQKLHLLKRSLAGSPAHDESNVSLVDDVIAIVVKLMSGQHSQRQPFQRVVIEGDRGIGSSGEADVGRVIKRVVAEAFTEATFRSSNQPGGMSANGWLPYNGMGIGPISMYATSPTYAPPSAYRQNGASAYGQYAPSYGTSYGASYGASFVGSPGQISRHQVVLQQQLKPVVGAALDALQRLQPLSQTIDFAELAALRAATAADLNALLEEANRGDGPRRSRAQRYLDQLDVHLDALGNILEEEDNDGFDSNEEESRRALAELFGQQVSIVKRLWTFFFARAEDGSFSQVVFLAQRLLGSIDGATRAWVEEMDAFGFTFEERRVAPIGDRSGALKRALQNDDIVDRIDAVKDYLNDLASLTRPLTLSEQAT
jgi:hypothetical protein